MRTCGKQHVGECTQGEVWQRVHVEAMLRAAGWVLNIESAEWMRGEDRGRLSWAPDFCRQDLTDYGKRFWLQRPNWGGRIELLG